MRFLSLLSVAAVAPAALAALLPRENLCSLKSPPEICKPNPATTVEETAKRAYQFYRSFVVDGDPKLMFSLIDKDYIVRSLPLRHATNPADSRSNTMPVTNPVPRTSGLSFAPAGRLAVRRARPGASTPAQTCRTRPTEPSTAGDG
jgi:hypothetical protein